VSGPLKRCRLNVNQSLHRHRPAERHSEVRATHFSSCQIEKWITRIAPEKIRGRPGDDDLLV
jgi:hypothetical protein